MSTTFTPTPEQDQALSMFSFGDSIAVEAGAGTGKTSTLQLMANSTPRRGAYLAFNKAIVNEAKRKMPAHVMASTAHGLAFRQTGRQFAHRLNSGRMKSMQLARQLGIDPQAVSYGTQRKVLSAGFLASHLMTAVERFCQSADDEPSGRHVPYIDGIDLPTGKGDRTYDQNDRIADYLVPFMVEAWADLSDPDGRLPYRHSHYLKAWQLARPRLAADFILFDEAQDASPVMLDVIRRQTHAQLVFVGDSQQAIYGFTGALNALQQVPADRRTFLSQSFRFGPAVADIANVVLGMLDAELTLKGSPHVSSVVGPVAAPDVVLTRTNAGAMQQVLDGLRSQRRVHMVGGGAEIVAFAKAAADLIDGRQTFHHELACFDTWTEVVEYVEHDPQGTELKLLVGLVEDYSPAALIGALDRMIPEDRADLVVSTAHKSKGREWSSVALGADFPDPAKYAGPLPADELRLIYVACTRAQHELDVDACPLFAGPEHAVVS